MTTIVLADDHKMIRESLAHMTQQMGGLMVVGEAANGQEAIDQATAHKPEVIFMDIVMPEIDGIEATREILRLLPETKVIALTSHTQSKMIQEMFKAGALAFLGKDCKPNEIQLAIESVLASRYYVSEALTGSVIENFVMSNKPKITAFSDNLTLRERQVLKLIAEGYSSKEIADRLDISAKTIGAHRENLMKKLDLHNIAGLTRYAIQRGIVDFG